MKYNHLTIKSKHSENTVRKTLTESIFALTIQLPNMPGLYFNITAVNQRQLNFAHLTAGKLLAIVNDPEFHQKVRSGNYTGRKFRLDGPRLKYIQANNDRIINQILTGKEWGAAGNGNIDLKLTVGATRPGTLGYVRPPNPLITTSPLFYNRCMDNNRPISLAAHWMHEWLHVSGFRHASSTPDRNDVNYTIGRFVIEVAQKHAKAENEPESYIKTIGDEYLNSFMEHADTVDKDEDLLNYGKSV